MKTTVITLAILSISQISYLKAQINYYPSVNFTPSPIKLKQYDPSVLLNNGSSHTTAAPTNPPPVYHAPIRETNPSVESRVVGYYKDGISENITWKRISLKVDITTNNMGQDELKVTAYINEIGNWSTINYGSVSKTSGEIAKEYTYQTSVNGKTVYFNI